MEFTRRIAALRCGCKHVAQGYTSRKKTRHNAWDGTMTRRSLRGVVLTNLAEKLPRRTLAEAHEARLVDEGGVVAMFWLN